MEEYVSNSKKPKESYEKKEKKVEPVVTNPARQKKKSEFRKLTDIFIAEDISNVKSYILMDIIIPAVKDAIEDVVHMILRGDSGKGRRSTTASKVSYRSYYDRDKRTVDDFPRVRAGYDFDEYILDNRGEAEEVLSQMDDMISRYGVVSVADFYELIGVNGNYTDNKYGWTNIRNAQVVRVREGYTIKLPRAMPIN